ncbi:hypothetical protein [Actinomadura fibrosa]|uniref:Uncharacterized protein n=1 Tax=Actinomadura fibrosa TaxID=111802 RepID=A0ABW2XY82_9ACTN|nr:hypothetical protein [Actinomadura fibrosa]
MTVTGAGPRRGARRQRTGNARSAADGMKLHRRTLRLDGREHTVIGLRPGTAARFSTNRFHDTWHVLSDGHGARVLGRLLWGLSYQSRPGTLLMIDRPFLVPTPFDGDPADPVVLVPAWHTPFTARTARALARALPASRPPDGTVRWRTHGLDAALEDPKAWFARHRLVPDEGIVERLHGLVALKPRSAAEMRYWAIQAGQMGNPSGTHGMAYDYLGPWRRSSGHSGEIQIFRDFHRDVSVARQARAEVLARGDAPEDPGELRPLVWWQHGVVKDRLAASRRARPAEA